jgi:transcriptional regulator with XRE-family HTH domain
MVDGINIKLLGEHLRRLRKERKLRLIHVHDQTRVSIASLSRIERGGSKELDSATLFKLCDWMKLPVEMFKNTPGLPARLRRSESTADLVELHLRADRKLDKKTADALAMMFRTAYERFTADH